MDNSPFTLQVLCAADTDVLQHQLVGFLTKLAWQYRVAAGVQAAVRALGEARFDVVIAGLSSRSPSAREFVHTVREAAPDQALILIVPPHKLPEALAAGASDVLSEPFDAGLLEQSLQRLALALRMVEYDAALYRYVPAETTVIECSSAEFSEIRVPLLIAGRLQRAGIINARCRQQLELAFQEVLANALEHGNLELESAWREELDDKGVDRFSRTRAERLQEPRFAQRKIQAVVQYADTTITIVVRDQGQGFAQAAIDGVIPNDQCHGRGMAILKATMDEVRFSDGGRTVTLVKRLQNVKTSA